MTSPARYAVDGEHLLESLLDLNALQPIARRPDLKLIVLDDELLPTADRAGALTRVRECAPLAALIYVAADHNFETEKWARGFGISYYASKPVEFERFKAILRSFLQLDTKPAVPKWLERPSKVIKR